MNIQDNHPDRLTNPLLEIPQGSMSGDPTLSVSEFLKMMEIYLPEPDTFPLSYYAKVLGLDVAVTKDGKISVERNGEQKSQNDDWHHIPKLGTYGREKSRLKNESLASIDEDGSRGNRDLDYIDPTWSAILNEYNGTRDDNMKHATDMNKPHHLSEACISLAKKLNITNMDTCFRIASTNDLNSIGAISEVCVIFVIILYYFYSTSNFANFLELVGRRMIGFIQTVQD